MVLFFHAGFGWMSGGYLGVSLFFTLSGYLITTLLLTEQAANGRISLRRFYARRAKRLLPASMLCIAAVMIARLMGELDRVDTLRRDAVAAILQVFNWVRLSGATSYADLFSDSTGATTSPLEHYWSLAIEEQFYVIWPVALIGLVAFARRRQRPVTTSIVILTVLCGAAGPAIAGLFGTDAAYWATPARLAEILVGASLAAWLRGRAEVSTVTGGASGRRHLALPAVLAIVGLAGVVPSGRGPAYHGLLPLFALLSGTLIWSLQTPSSVRRLLSVRPLVLVGRVSYGVYIFHWPIFVLLRQHGWELSSWRGFTIATVITGSVAVVSYLLVEQPIREASWPRPRMAMMGVIGVAAAVAVVAITPTARPFLHVDTELLDDAAIRPVDSLVPLVRVAAAPSTSSTISLPPLVPPTPVARAPVPTGASSAPSTTTTVLFDSKATLTDAAPSRPVRILVLGDSTSLYVAQGLAAWSLQYPAYAQASVIWSQGCGFILDGTITSFEAARFVQGSRDLIRTDLPDAVTELRPDVVVLMTTINDVTDRQWTPSEGSLRPEDPAFRTRMLAAYVHLQDSILALGVPNVVWIVPPAPIPISPYPELNDPVRYAVQGDIIRSVASSGPAGVGVVDLNEWFERTGAADDDEWRPDGVHMTADSATNLAAWYLGPEIVNQVLDPR